jgi:hypothetical protein
MALVIADRVQETTTTTGTGTVTLLGAVTGFQSFAAIGNGNATYYNISAGTEWEVGIGTYTSSGTTLSRTTVLSSSNSGSLVNFSAGTKNVFVTYPAERSINLDDTGNLAQAVTVGLGTGRLPVEQVYRLNSTLAGSNATGAQNILGAGVTLVGSTVYQFECVFATSKTAGTTSHNFQVGFGGSATVNNIAYFFSRTASTTSFTDVSAYQELGGYIQTASFTTVINASTAATLYATYIFKGTVSINAGGTFIPQYNLSVAPGGAYTVALGAYFKISPLGASGANTNIGIWA